MKNELILYSLLITIWPKDLLKESKLLVTDFSSVYFDFGYMRKPVVHFQFDESTFNDNHYTKGYFDYRRDGFGDVCLKTEDTVDSIIKIINGDFTVEDKYLKRMNSNFVYRDDKNCERIFNRICVLRQKNEWAYRCCNDVQSQGLY